MFTPTVWEYYEFRYLDPETINHWIWLQWKYVWEWKRKKFEYYRNDSGYHESNRIRLLSPNH